MSIRFLALAAILVLGLSGPALADHPGHMMHEGHAAHSNSASGHQPGAHAGSYHDRSAKPSKKGSTCCQDGMKECCCANGKCPMMPEHDHSKCKGGKCPMKHRGGDHHHGTMHHDGAAMTHGDSAHAAHGGGVSGGPEARALDAAMARMHKDMAKPYTGDADADFVRGMIPHHQGAIDMATIVLKYGDDPQTRQLARQIIRAQKGEIALMRRWLERRQLPESAPIDLSK